jgi:hypothetical protein
VVSVERNSLDKVARNKFGLAVVDIMAVYHA